MVPLDILHGSNRNTNSNILTNPLKVITFLKKKYVFKTFSKKINWIPF